MPKTIEISHRTILFTIAIILGGWIIYQVRDIIFLLFISFILMTALRPLVIKLESFRVPPVLAILLIYVVVLGGIGTVIGSMVPVIISQTTSFSQRLPALVEQVAPSFSLSIQEITQQVAPITQNVLKVGVEIVNNVVTVVTILVFTFYLLLGGSKIRKTVSEFVGEEYSSIIFSIVNDLEVRLGGWARGQILLMFSIGIFTYIGLFILGVEYALPLAVFAGLLEAVPMVGPIISAVPAVLYALTVSPLFALTVAALYFVTQQLENHLLVPFVMKKSVGLSPIITIVAIMVGARFEGVIGAILAIPTVLVAQVVFSHLLNRESEQK